MKRDLPAIIHPPGAFGPRQTILEFSEIGNGAASCPFKPLVAGSSPAQPTIFLPSESHEMRPGGKSIVKNSTSKSNLWSHENSYASDINQLVVRRNWTPPKQINAV